MVAAQKITAIVIAINFILDWKIFFVIAFSLFIEYKLLYYAQLSALLYSLANDIAHYSKSFTICQIISVIKFMKIA